MPIYEYEHLEKHCERGRLFEIKQSMRDESLTQCPTCQGAVRKRLSRFGLNISRTDAEIRDLGFTKLVKRDLGVYENVTRRGRESRYMEAGKPETVPDLSKIISD